MSLNNLLIKNVKSLIIETYIDSNTKRLLMQLNTKKMESLDDKDKWYLSHRAKQQPEDFFIEVVNIRYEKIGFGIYRQQGKEDRNIFKVFRHSDGGLIGMYDKRDKTLYLDYEEYLIFSEFLPLHFVVSEWADYMKRNHKLTVDNVKQISL